MINTTVRRIITLSSSAKHYTTLRNFNELKDYFPKDPTVVTVGENNFLFGMQLFSAFDSRMRLVATTALPDGSNEDITEGRKENINRLKHEGAEVMYHLKPSIFSEDARLKAWFPSDRVIYHHPIRATETDLKCFLKDSATTIDPIDGEAVWFDRKGGPHSKWNLESIARECGMELLEELRVPFWGPKNSNVWSYVRFGVDDRLYVDFLSREQPFDEQKMIEFQAEEDQMKKYFATWEATGHR